MAQIQEWRYRDCIPVTNHTIGSLVLRVAVTWSPTTESVLTLPLVYFQYNLWGWSAINLMIDMASPMMALHFDSFLRRFVLFFSASLLCWSQLNAHLLPDLHFLQEVLLPYAPHHVRGASMFFSSTADTIWSCHHSCNSHFVGLSNHSPNEPKIHTCIAGCLGPLFFFHCLFLTLCSS